MHSADVDNLTGVDGLSGRCIPLKFLQIEKAMKAQGPKQIGITSLLLLY